MENLHARDVFQKQQVQGFFLRELVQQNRNRPPVVTRVAQFARFRLRFRSQREPKQRPFEFGHHVTPERDERNELIRVFPQNVVRDEVYLLPRVLRLR